MEKNVMRLVAVQHLRLAYGIKTKNWNKNKTTNCKTPSSPVRTAPSFIGSIPGFHPDQPVVPNRRSIVLSVGSNYAYSQTFTDTRLWANISQRTYFVWLLSFNYTFISMPKIVNQRKKRQLMSIISVGICWR